MLQGTGIDIQADRSRHNVIGSGLMSKLPLTLAEWNRSYQVPGFWEALRNFFLSCGYELYQTHGYDPFRPQAESQSHPGLSFPASHNSPACDSFGLHGDRRGYKSQFWTCGLLTAARDRKNRDVVIKVVSKGQEGLRELNILRLLNTEPLVSDPHNATIPVIEFLTLEDWHFAVMPFHSMCDEVRFTTPEEVFEFAGQLFEGLCFLHTNGIAHLDITNENLAINHHGSIEQYHWDPNRSPPPPFELFRKGFSVKYKFLDFGLSHCFSPETTPPDRLIEPFEMSQAMRAPAPEVNGESKFDPFAADVYQVAQVLFCWFHPVALYFPQFLEILQDMVSLDPRHRISIFVARDRLRDLRGRIPGEDLQGVLDLEIRPDYNIRLKESQS